MSLNFQLLEMTCHIKLPQDFNVKTYRKRHKFYLVVSNANLMETITELKNERGCDFSSDWQ